MMFIFAPDGQSEELSRRVAYCLQLIAFFAWRRAFPIVCLALWN